MIFWFSGTGNSEYVAKRIGEKTGKAVVSLNDAIKQGTVPGVETGESVAFCVPTYSWRIPRVVEALIEKMQFIPGQKAYFLMTCGDEIGNSAKYIRKLCKKKNLQFAGVAGIVMPENYIAMFSAPGKEKAAEIIEKAEPVIDLCGEIISKGTIIADSFLSISDRAKSDFVNPLFYSLCVKDKKFYSKNECTGCGLCAKKCPLNNIKIENNKPVWGGNCTHCMACICHCPVEAVEYGKASQGQPRYTCPK